jgi:chromate transporter
MSPTVIAMLIASGWLLATANTATLSDWRLWATTGVTAILIIDGRVNMFWLLAIGGTLGALGLVA